MPFSLHRLSESLFVPTIYNLAHVSRSARYFTFLSCIHTCPFLPYLMAASPHPPELYVFSTRNSKSSHQTLEKQIEHQTPSFINSPPNFTSPHSKTHPSPPCKTRNLSSKCKRINSSFIALLVTMKYQKNTLPSFILS